MTLSHYLFTSTVFFKQLLEFSPLNRYFLPLVTVFYCFLCISVLRYIFSVSLQCTQNMSMFLRLFPCDLPSTVFLTVFSTHLFLLFHCSFISLFPLYIYFHQFAVFFSVSFTYLLYFSSLFTSDVYNICVFMFTISLNIYFHNFEYSNFTVIYTYMFFFAAFVFSL